AQDLRRDEHRLHRCREPDSRHGRARGDAARDRPARRRPHRAPCGCDRDGIARRAIGRGACRAAGDAGTHRPPHPGGLRLRAPRRMLLSAPGAIGPLRLKNRVIMAPMGTNYGTTDGFSTDRDKRYYAERARGGVALIVTEAMNVSAGARNHTNSLCVFHDSFIPGLAAVVDAIHGDGALAVAQLNHRGQLLRRSVLGMEPVGPSPGRTPGTGEPVRALGESEIRAIQRDFVDAARRLRWAGYDGVEIHAANGYLFHQFFSERFNRRDDQYGG